ncbi:MAG: DUF362 domain-containing protein [Chloroflexi bacterium]|nr:DUF362 domain-containing protein [Chloroflexota bacterium]
MTRAEVYYSDLRTEALGDGLPTKLKKLIKAAGLGQINMDGKFVGIKTHFGELGNLGFLRPNYARAVVDVVKELGGRPFLTDCNTMYVGSRNNALDHLECAWQNGFTPLTVGCPIIIADGLKGTDDVQVPVIGGEYVEEASIGRAIMDAEVFISLTHFKGHELAGFGGAIKNIGMGCGSRAGKTEQHSNGQAQIDAELCRGCRRCERECANNGLEFDQAARKMRVNRNNCVGCGHCLGACSYRAISFEQDAAVVELNRRMAEYAKAVIQDRPSFHISLVIDVSPNCDCHCENDAPIIPDQGMFASFDPLALDQACIDACLKAEPLPGSQLYDNMQKPGFVDRHDPFCNATPASEWRTCLEHAAKIGLGTREYDLVKI